MKMLACHGLAGPHALSPFPSPAPRFRRSCPSFRRPRFRVFEESKPFRPYDLS